MAKTERDGPQPETGIPVGQKGSVHHTVFEDEGQKRKDLDEQVEGGGNPDWGNPRANIDRGMGADAAHSDVPNHMRELEKAGHKGVRVGGIAHPGSGERASKNITVTHGDRKVKPL